MSKLTRYEQHLKYDAEEAEVRKHRLLAQLHRHSPEPFLHFLQTLENNGYTLCGYGKEQLRLNGKIHKQTVH